MARFCTSCGAALEDDASFCTSCGAAQETAPAEAPQAESVQSGMDMSNVTQAAGAAAKNAAEKVKNTFDGVNFDSVKNSMSMENIKNVGKTKDKNVIIGICAIVLVVIIIAAFVISSIGAPYTKPVESMFKAFEKLDGKALVDAFPDYQIEYFEDNLDAYEEWFGTSYDSVSEYIEEELLEDIADELEDDYGKNYKFSYKVTKKKELKKKALNELEDDVKKNYDEKVDVTKGYELKLKVTIKGKDDKDTENMKINVYKIDGKWCITEIASV